MDGWIDGSYLCMDTQCVSLFGGVALCAEKKNDFSWNNKTNSYVS